MLFPSETMKPPATDFPVLSSPPPGPQDLKPVPIVGLDELKSMADTLPADWHLECLTLEAAPDMTTEAGQQMAALHMLQMTATLRLLFERLTELEKRFDDHSHYLRDARL